MSEIFSEPWTKGCLQVYTGHGKGKTTAAFGLALRAAGRGLPVFIGQFMKGYEYGETVAVRRFSDLVTLEQFGSATCIPWKEAPGEVDVKLAAAGLGRCREILKQAKHRIVVLDEICVAVHFRLFDEADLLDLVDLRPDGVELVCTGRYAPKALIERADLVTEMKEIRHPFNTEKLSARDGIER
jgi:cob(I)alamin adenosyltransferase